MIILSVLHIRNDIDCINTQIKSKLEDRLLNNGDCFDLTVKEINDY